MTGSWGDSRCERISPTAIVTNPAAPNLPPHRLPPAPYSYRSAGRWVARPMSDRDLRPLAGEGAPPTDAFRQMAEQAPIGMVAARPDGAVVWVNRRWREMTGIDQPIPIPYEVVEPIIHPDDRVELRQAYSRAGGDVLDLRVQLAHRPAGRRGPARAGPGRSGARRGGHDHRLRRDHHRPHRDGRAQRRPATQRRAVPQPHRQGPDGPDGGDARRARSSRSTTPTPALVGRTPEELSGTSALALVHPDDRDSAIEMAAMLLRGEVEADRARAPAAAPGRHRPCGCRAPPPSSATRRQRP